MKVHYRARALSDLEEIFQYINKRSPGGARNVIDAIHDAIAYIAEYPLAAERTSYSGIHVKVVRQYRYKIFYRAGADHVEILHVRHGARRPWSPQK
jgi:toxin ParE1/3/4